VTALALPYPFEPPSATRAIGKGPAAANRRRTALEALVGPTAGASDAESHSLSIQGTVAMPSRAMQRPFEPTSTPSVGIDSVAHVRAVVDAAIRGVAETPLDWDVEGASPPNHIAIGLARSILQRLIEMGITRPDVRASVEEGISIFCDAGPGYTLVECFNSGEIVAATSDGRGKLDVWEVGSNEVEKALIRVRRHARAMSQ